MIDSESALAELKKMAAWADTQRKVTKWSLISLAVFIPALIVLAVVMEQRWKTRIGNLTAPEPPTWGSVDWNITQCNLDEAIRIGEELVQKTPQYWRGHDRLASAYLAAGKVEKARQH